MEKKPEYNVAVIGVGAVGVELLRILKERVFPIGTLRVFARSSRNIEIDKDTYHVEALEGADVSDIDIALFAGTEGEKGASVTYADRFIDAGAVVIDNGADFRLKEGVPLIVPEANRQEIKKHKGIIANPNCTTIQAVVALAPVHKKFGLTDIILTSFQATSGAGRRAVQALWDEAKGVVAQNEAVRYASDLDVVLPQPSGVFAGQIAFNVLPHIGGFDEQGYTSEERKVVYETHKILDDDSIKISATCARVPVFTSHSEAIYFRTRKVVSTDALIGILREAESVTLSEGNAYPVALTAQGTDEVFVGRVRPDPYQENAFWMWVVADNLRKGAALNAVQIAEGLIA